MRRNSRGHLRLLPSRSASGSLFPEVALMDGPLERDVRSLRADLDLLGERIVALGGDPVETADGPSPMTKSDPTTAKLQLVMLVIRRIHLVDSLVLRATEPALPSRGPGRSSVGRDLHLLPAHLRLVDRLRDLYDRSRRQSMDTDQVEQGKVARLEVERTEFARSLESTRRERAGLREQLQEVQRQAKSLENALGEARREIERLRDLAKTAELRPPPKPVGGEHEPMSVERLVQSLPPPEDSMSDPILIDKFAFTELLQGLSVSADRFRTLWNKYVAATETKRAQDVDRKLEFENTLVELVREKSNLQNNLQIVSEECLSRKTSEIILLQEIDCLKEGMSSLKTQYDNDLSAMSVSLENHQKSLRKAHNLLEEKDQKLFEVIKQSEELADELLSTKSQLSMTEVSLESSENTVVELLGRVRAKVQEKELDTFEEAMRNEMRSMREAYERRLGILNETIKEMKQHHKSDMALIQSAIVGKSIERYNI